MFSKWKNGLLAYRMRGIVYVLIGAAVGTATAFGLSFALGGYGLARHPLSSVGIAAFLAILPFALRRRRWIRFGHQALWLKAHWLLAGFGLSLVLIHSAATPGTWSGWLAFSLALVAFASGLAVHFTTKQARRRALWAHLSAAIALVAGFSAHGLYKLRHDWFPLETPTPKNEVVHDAACVVCHEERNRYAEYECRGCHVHATEELAHHHGTHGVPEWGRCLDCHKATIQGRKYYTGDGWRFVPGEAFDFSAERAP